jgi:hypothetical protein
MNSFPSLLLPRAGLVALLATGLALSAQAASPPTAPPVPVPATQQDILDIRPPIHLPVPFPWLGWGAGAAGALAIWAGAWAFWRRPKVKLPYQIALERLAQTRPLMQAETVEPFSSAVSEIVRGFIEISFPVRAAHRTTQEFLHDLAKLSESPLAGHRVLLSHFLYYCDLAKFARWTLSAEQMEELLAKASDFVVAVGKADRRKKRAESAPAAPAAPLLAA